VIARGSGGGRRYGAPVSAAPPSGPRPLDLAVAVLAEWRATGRTPRDLFAQIVPPTLPAATRAELAATVYGTIRDERRLEWALGGARGLPLEGAARDAALLLAFRVASGETAPAAAAARLADWTPAALPFGAVLAAERAFDAIADPVLRFSVRHSLPEWLARLLLDEHGAAAAPFALALRCEPPRALRANLLRGSRDDVAAALLAERVPTSPGAFADTALLALGDAPLFATAAYERGLFEQQDEGSQLIAQLTAPPPRGKVLDVCAGSGGKTLALAALLQNRGSVLACDVHERRLAELRPRAARAGAQNLQWAVVEEDRWPEPVCAFAAAADRILLDVPCSGIGAWRRRPEARWALLPTALEALQRTQQALLDRAAASLRPGARLVYATCTLRRAENEAQVESALQRHPQLELVRAREVLGGGLADRVADPGGTFLALRPDVQGTDGFFAAVLRRRRG
jgi:16S rRNA (cytosine967-C5)-methyltransferase